jgi:hypothetical protein
VIILAYLGIPAVMVAIGFLLIWYGHKHPYK